MVVWLKGRKEKRKGKERAVAVGKWKIRKGGKS